MPERTTIIIDAEAWRLELLAVVWDIVDAEPMTALNRIDRLLDELAPDAWCNGGAH